MDQFKMKSMYFKLGLSIVLIRHKPVNLPLDEYVRLFQLEFRNNFKHNLDQINELKSQILTLKQELFQIKIKDLTPTNETLTNNEPVDQLNKNMKLNELDYRCKFRSHIEFMSSLIKLKRIGASFTSKQLLNEVSSETIFETLLVFLHQINYFYCESNLLVVDVETNQECLNESSLYPMPKDTLEHSISLFVNVFSLEWIYYLRRNLINDVVLLIDNLNQFIINCDPAKENDLVKQECGCNMLVIISSSDYLLNSVLTSIVKSIQLALDDLIKEYEKKKAFNCNQLCVCIERCLKQRQLDNFSNISSQLKSLICQTFNKLVIDITNLNDPLLIFQLTKLIQILSV